MNPVLLLYQKFVDHLVKVKIQGYDVETDFQKQSCYTLLIIALTSVTETWYGLTQSSLIPSVAYKFT